MLERERQTGTETHTERLERTVNLPSRAHRDPEVKAPAETSLLHPALQAHPYTVVQHPLTPRPSLLDHIWQTQGTK